MTLRFVAPGRSGQQRREPFHAAWLPGRLSNVKASNGVTEFGISYLDGVVRACCPPGLAGTLRRQFLAYGAVADTGEGAPTVSVHVSGDERAPLLPEGERLQVPHGGGDLARLPGVSLVHDGPPLSVVSVAEPDITATVYGSAPYLPFIHYLVKYPLRAVVERQGAVLAHSAAVVSPGGGACLFLGPSGAGKTTVFIEMLARGFQVLGNDATLLRERGGHVEAVLWPHVLRIGPGTIADSQVLGKLPDTWAPRNPRDGKAEVFLDTLDEIFGRPTGAPPARVTAVAGLAPDFTSTVTEIRHLDQDAARQLLAERLVGDCPRTGWLPGWQWQPDLARRHAIADALAAGVPAYQVRLGAAAKAWADEIAQWLSDLPDAAEDEPGYRMTARAGAI